MKKKITYSTLDEDMKDIDRDVAIEEEREHLENERKFLQMVIYEKIADSPEYKRIVDISNILNIKMVALSKEERQQEFDEASKLITEREFD